MIITETKAKLDDGRIVDYDWCILRREIQPVSAPPGFCYLGAGTIHSVEGVSWEGVKYRYDFYEKDTSELNKTKCRRFNRYTALIGEVEDG